MKSLLQQELAVIFKFQLPSTMSSMYSFILIKVTVTQMDQGRQCSPVVRVLALKSGDPGFKTRSDHS